MVFVLCVPLSMPMKYSFIVASDVVEDLPIADCGLRIADLLSPRILLLLRRLLRETVHPPSIRNPQSAIRNPQSAIGRSSVFSLSWAPQKYCAARQDLRWP